MNCPLQASSTKFMDEYLEGHGYGPISEEDQSSHPFHRRPCYVKAVGSRFRPVSPISLRTTPDSEIQDFRDLDCEMYPACPFRGVHVLAYTDDTYPIVLPTRSSHTIITEQLSHSMLELVKPLPMKDSLLSRSEFVKAQHTAVDPAPSGSSHGAPETVQTTVEPVEAADGACPIEAVRRGQEMDSRTEVEAAPQEPAPSQGAFRPFRTASQTDAPQAAMKLFPGGFRMKAQRKSPPPFVSDTAEEAPQSATESFDLGGGDPQLPDVPEELDGPSLQAVPLTVQDSAPLSAEGATNTQVTTAPVTTSNLLAPQLTEDGRVLPPCTVDCFPAPHPDWAIRIGEKELNDLLPSTLPVIPGVAGNRSTSLLSLDFGKFIPKEKLSAAEVRLRTATSIQKVLRKALVHPSVEESLHPAPTVDRHPGLVTVEDLRCLSEKERMKFSADGIEFFFPISQDHITGGPMGHARKIKQYLLACLVFGWYPAHFRQKKVAKDTISKLGSLSKRINELDGGLATFQSCNSITMCPFPDCLYMCSSQYAVVKYAMLQHYHTMMVCGSCLCHFAPSLTTSMAVGCTTVSFKEHILMCGSMANPPPAGPSTGEGPSTSSTPISVPSSSVASGGNADLARDDASSARNDADDTSSADKADGAERAVYRRHLTAVFGGSSDSSDAEDETRASRKRNRDAMLGDGDDSKKTHPAKRFRKTQD